MSLQPSFLSRVRLPLSATLVATAVLAAAPTTLAGAPVQDGAGASEKDLTGVAKSIGDFVHYVLIGKADLAQAAGDAALSATSSDADLAEAVDGNDMAERLARAVSRSRSMEGVSEIAARLESRVEAGRRALARDGDRIAEAIGMLTKTLREQRLGEERLAAAGEYAVPQLLKTIVDTKDPAVELAATKALIGLKRLAVAPLGLSLGALDPASQRKVVGVLAEIGWPTALPYIVDLGARPSTTVEVKAACDAAFTQLGGTTRDVTAQYTALARKYFDRESSLVPYPDDSVNSVWSHQDGGGFGSLVSSEVSTGVYCDVMAMALARRALAADAGNTSALAIYVASDLRRENTLGGDAQPGRYSPQFFATASGASTCSEVLGMAIDARDTALVRDAIAVLSQTASGMDLVSGGGRAPMLEAMGYSDRRVRLDAALVLAGSNPTQSFAGDFRVVPTLASAISDSGGGRAAILGGADSDRRVAADMLGSIGFSAIASGGRFEEIENDVARAEGVDLVVALAGMSELNDVIARVRASGLTSAAPVVVVSPDADEQQIRRAMSGDASVAVWTSSGSKEAFGNAARAVALRTSGASLDEAESAEYAAAAATALRGIAFGGSKVFSIADAEPALLRALETKQGGLRLMVAEVLALIGSPQAQRALIDSALSSSGEEQVALCDFAAYAARVSGAKADDRQLSALRELIRSAEGANADAAGRLYGSLDAGTSEAVKLITGE